MITISGYKIKSLIYQSKNSLIYRAKQESKKQPVILKVLRQEYPTLEEIVRYKKEYQILCQLDIENVIKAYQIKKHQNKFILFLEDFGGESLDALLKSISFSIKEFLLIAVQVTKALEGIHSNNIIHKDINPSNIIFNRKNGQVKIIDFGISTFLPRENTTLKNPNILEGTLAYISPEQTGRMNCSLDYRTDFYSLGATFYKLLTGQLPFTQTDVLELIHCHIALEPIPPHQINPNIPKIISDIVMKLMAKNPQDRYQSALGIKLDLEKCLFQLQNHSRIEEFLIGVQDISERLQIGQKLYGREQEIDILLKAFERIRGGKSELTLISGYSGIGKSALVREVYKPVTEAKGYFIAGKFDQYQKDLPYSAIIQAFQELIKYLLTENEATLARWREKILDALGVNAQLIINVISEVELIVGKQPEVASLTPKEAQNRLNLAFVNFIKVFAQPEHPLVIFLDDLQWADSASLQLLQMLMNVSALKYLFVIGAYRDNEVNPAHPLILTLNEIEKTGAVIERIFLLPLGLGDVNQLIVDSLKSSWEKVRSLSKLVLAKTNGNPFFINEFLHSLYREKLLYFDY
ncbi:MAG: AAA family ATPase, partial [Prochloraceae cyanobacterium]|nr:AAA family ATPase [Prochloraceae cyanobacterium]